MRILVIVMAALGACTGNGPSGSPELGQSVQLDGGGDGALADVEVGETAASDFDANGEVLGAAETVGADGNSETSGTCTGAGALGCPCVDAADCDSKVCVALPSGSICSTPCESAADCPGLFCLATGVTSPARLCLPLDARLCQPCTADADCEAEGLLLGNGACIDHDGAGRFCAVSCSKDSDCPAEYGCDAVLTTGGATRAVCRPASGNCECNALSVVTAIATPCVPDESCAGTRACLPDGLGPCVATGPAETCNGLDDDCDGATDENPCTDGPCEDATCNGGAGCSFKPIECDDGNPCTADTCGEAGCEYVPSSGACDDGNGCTVEDSCTDGGCTGTTTTLCDDDNPCTTDDCVDSNCLFLPKIGPCDADGDPCSPDQCLDGACGAVAGPDCNDDDPCTTDLCLSGVCTHGLATGACDDGDACTTGDVCGSSGCHGLPCADGNPCTADLCQEGTCTFIPASGECERDGDPCTPDACAEGECVAYALDCDDQNPCTTDECTPFGCASTATPGPCDDDNPCTDSDTCNGEACLGTITMTCNDENPCTADLCTESGCSFPVVDGACELDDDACTPDQCESGTCKPAPLKDCDDDNPCTTDGCSGGVCFGAPKLGPCDDGDACTKEDGCALGVCVGVATCDDGNPCTDDACAAGSCSTTANIAPCDLDDDACTLDQCAATACSAGPPKLCDDTNPCTSNQCALGACAFAPTTGSCDDGNACTQGDTCAGGACSPGATITCDDANPCTVDTCGGAGCNYVGTVGPCDRDGDLCTRDLCVGGECAAGAAQSCVDGNPCTADACTLTSCSHVDAPGPCDDGQACTFPDSCVDGGCAGPLQDCDDQNECTDDTCTGSGCGHEANQEPCDLDGSTCTDDVCSDSECTAGPVTLCDDGDVCTSDACGSGNCEYLPLLGACNDGDACTKGDVCTPTGCTGTSFGPCNDQNPCTFDSCNGTACTYLPAEGPCDVDGLACTLDACKDGACQPGPAPSCDDGSACTVDGCNLQGCFYTLVVGPCDDGSLCTKDDVCTGFQCKGTAVVCNDGTVCTTDSCDAAKGCTHVAANSGAACESDGLACTTDSCFAGACKHTSTCTTTAKCTKAECTAGGCVTTAAATGTQCDDGKWCTVEDVCGAGQVCSGKPRCATCRTSSGCDETGDYCLGTALPAGTECNSDGDPCTSEACSSGTCTATGLPPCPNVGCGARTCEAVAGAKVCKAAPGASPAGTVCDDGLFCTVESTCDSDAGCTQSVPRDCASELGGCRTGVTCDAGGCKYTGTKSQGSSCVDGFECTAAGTCDADAKCVSSGWTCPYRPLGRVHARPKLGVVSDGVIVFSGYVGDDSHYAANRLSDDLEVRTSGAGYEAAVYSYYVAHAIGLPNGLGVGIGALPPSPFANPTVTQASCFPCGGQCCGSDLQPIAGCSCAPNCSLNDKYYTFKSTKMTMGTGIIVMKQNGSSVPMGIVLNFPDSESPDGVVDTCTNPRFPDGSLRLMPDSDGGIYTLHAGSGAGWVANRFSPPLFDEQVPVPLSAELRAVLDYVVDPVGQGWIQYKEGSIRKMRRIDGDLEPFGDIITLEQGPSYTGVQVLADGSFIEKSTTGIVRFDATGKQTGVLTATLQTATGLADGRTLTVSGGMYAIRDSSMKIVFGPAPLGPWSQVYSTFESVSTKNGDAVVVYQSDDHLTRSDFIVRIAPNGQVRHQENSTLLGTSTTALGTVNDSDRTPAGTYLITSDSTLAHAVPGTPLVRVASQLGERVSGNGALVASAKVVTLFPGTANKSYVIGVDYRNAALGAVKTGVAAGPEVPVKDYPKFDLAMAADGRTLVLWGQVGPVAGSSSVRFRMLDATGTISGSENALWSGSAAISDLRVERSPTGGFFAWARRNKTTSITFAETRVWRIDGQGNVTGEFALTSPDGKTAAVEGPDGRVLMIELGKIHDLGYTLVGPVVTTVTSAFQMGGRAVGLVDGRFAIQSTACTTFVPWASNLDCNLRDMWAIFDPKTQRLSNRVALTGTGGVDSVFASAGGGLESLATRAVCSGGGPGCATSPELRLERRDLTCGPWGCVGGACGETPCLGTSCLLDSTSTCPSPETPGANP